MQTSMQTPRKPHPLQRLVVALAYLAASAAGLKYGYDFGAQISGKLLGVELAINSAIFGSILVAMLADRVFGPRAANRPEP